MTFEPSGMVNPEEVPADQIIDELAVLCGILAYQLHLLRDHPAGEGIQECGGYVLEVPSEHLETFDEHFEQTIVKQDDKFILTGTLKQPESQGNA